MRDYGKVSPQFWTGKTGKTLRGHMEAQIVALYLMTSPHSTMIGVFHLPKLYLAHETGLTMEGASKGLQRCIDSGFCVYDEETETVFVVEMAAHQVGEVLKPGDLRAKGIFKQYAAIADTPIGRAFSERYGVDYSLPKPLASPFEGALKSSEGASKPHSPVTASVPATAGRKRTKSPEVTLADWIAGLDGDAITADDPIFGWARTAGVPADWIGLAWWAFESRYGGDGKDRAKTYADWRAVFRTAVKEDWLRLWRKGRNAPWELTTAGESARLEMEAAR